MDLIYFDSERLIYHINKSPPLSKKLQQVPISFQQPYRVLNILSIFIRTFREKRRRRREKMHVSARAIPNHPLKQHPTLFILIIPLRHLVATLGHGHHPPPRQLLWKPLVFACLSINDNNNIGGAGAREEACLPRLFLYDGHTHKYLTKE